MKRRISWPAASFPSPSCREVSAAQRPQPITIQYKEFGVRLRFRPVVLGDGGIRLYAVQEVSELTDVGALVIQGFSIPALITRRGEATLELKSGQSFAMAGLIQYSDAADEFTHPRPRRSAHPRPAVSLRAIQEPGNGAGHSRHGVARGADVDRPRPPRCPGRPTRRRTTGSCTWRVAWKAAKPAKLDPRPSSGFRKWGWISLWVPALGIHTNK